MPAFRPKEFVLPQSMDEILKKLQAEGKQARIIAGGTAFYELARRGYIPEVKSVVSIMKVGMNTLDADSYPIRIGAALTLQELLNSGVGNRRGLEAVGDSLREIRPVQVRNVATVGGEVCISVPVVDLPTALLACGANLAIVSGAGEEKEVPLEGFYVDAFLTKLGYGELVKEVRIPSQHEGASSAFVKFGRTSYDFNLVNVAVSVSLHSDGTIAFVRVFLGGISRTPIHAIEFESKLVGKTPDSEFIEELAMRTVTKIDLLPSVHGSKEYKKEIIPVVVRECMTKALERQTEIGGDVH